MFRAFVRQVQQTTHPKRCGMQVDAVALGLPDYHSVVCRPADLGTIRDGLALGLAQVFPPTSRQHPNNCLGRSQSSATGAGQATPQSSLPWDFAGQLGAWPLDILLLVLHGAVIQGKLAFWQHIPPPSL